MAKPHLLNPGRFYGDVIKQTRMCDAVFSLVRHNAARTVPIHEHEAAYFCLLVSGRYTEYYDGRHLEYRPFTLAFHPPHYRHYDEIGKEGSVFFLIELAERWTERLSDVIDLAAVKVEVRGGALAWIAMRLFKEFTQCTSESTLHIESLLYELVAGAATLPDERASIEPVRLRMITDFVHANCTQQLSMQEIAVSGGVHPVTVARAFRTHFQQTASEYIHRLRVLHACELLLNTDETLSGISAECGFSDQSYFTKVFKGVVGSTPAAFRKTIRSSAGLNE
jgi:AraC family transcriptional regulator